MTIPTALSEDPFGFTGLTYDDVLLLPGNTDVIPPDADPPPRLSKRITLNTPIISAAMDTVTDSAMAIAMARLGGMGVIHRNLSIEDQAAHVDRVKRSESGMIINPVTIGADATIAEYDEVCPSSAKRACWKVSSPTAISATSPAPTTRAFASAIS